jgi:uncharacterized protein (DUF3084 family)
MKTTFLAPLACGALAATFSLAALAQAQTPPNKIITRDEFRSCMDNQDTLKAKADSIKERGAKLNAESDAIRAEDDELKVEQKRVEDSSMPLARERFDRKVKAHSNRVKAAEAESAKLRAEADQVSKELDAHNAKCSNVSISKDDREAVMKEREAAGKK